MKRVENLNAPSLSGWLIAVAAGILAFAVAKVIGQFDYTTSGFFGVVVALASGLVLGMPWGAADRIPRPEAAADSHAAPAPVAAAAAASAPVAAPMAAAAAPAAVMSSSVADTAPAPKAAPAAKVADAPKAKAAAAPKAAPAAKVATAKAAAPAKEAASPVAPKLKAAKAEAAAPEGGSKPKALKAARKGVADDLKVIEGIGPALEKVLNENGIFHVDQIAGWGAAEVEWMDGNLKGFKGRVTRDRWVAQAKLIGEVGVDEFLRRAKTNDY